MNLSLTKHEAAMLAAALARDAARHECQARSVKNGRHHDLAATEMRLLRTRIIALVVNHDRRPDL